MQKQEKRVEDPSLSTIHMYDILSQPQPTTIAVGKESQSKANNKQHHLRCSSANNHPFKTMSAKKSRFDGLDVAAMTSHLKRTILGFKLANVYDGSALGVNSSASGGGNDKAARGVYMFKLADPSSGPAVPDNKKNEEESKTDDEHKTNDGDNVTSATSSNAAVDSKRVMLLIESGVRFHPTT